MTLDKKSYKIIKQWNVDNLEYVLGTITNDLLKQHPMWYYLVPYDGLLEVLASLVMIGSINDSIDVGLRLIEIENMHNPLKEYRRIVTEAKSEQVTKGIDNIILNRYIKWCLAEQALSQSIYKVGPVDIIRDEFYSNAQALQNIYGGQWQRYYKKRIVA